MLKNIAKSSGRNLITPVTSSNSLAMAYTNSKLSNDQRRKRRLAIRNYIRRKGVGILKADGTHLTKDEKEQIMYEEIIPDLMIHIGSATLFEQALICILETGRSVNLIQTEINNSIASFVRSPSKGAYNYASRISHNLGCSRWNGMEEDLHCLQTGKGKAPMEL